MLTERGAVSLPGVSGPRTLIRSVLVVGLGLVIAESVFVLVTSKAGTSGAPEFSVPTETPALGYSYSVTVTPPWWAWPTALMAGALAAAGAWALTRSRR